MAAGGEQLFDFQFFVKEAHCNDLQSSTPLAVGIRFLDFPSILIYSKEAGFEW